jgi:hypothetical protein
MAHSIDDLRTVLVDHWSVLDKVRWKELVGILPDPVAMLHHLATQHRFTCHAAPGFVPFLTSEMKTAIDQGLPGELLHKFGSETWLRLRKLGEARRGPALRNEGAQAGNTFRHMDQGNQEPREARGM